MPPISSVLLAFSLLGELHTKLKSFGKTSYFVSFHDIFRKSSVKRMMGKINKYSLNDIDDGS